MKKLFPFLAILLVIICSECGDPKSPSDKKQPVLQVYTSKYSPTDELVWSMFEDRCGVRVHVVLADADELIRRMHLAGAECSADIFITGDSARLNHAKSKGLLARTNLYDIPVPFELKDPDNYWTAITYSAQVIAFNKDAVNPDDLEYYADLARPAWNGRLLLKASKDVRTQSLVADMLYNYGEENITLWTEALVKNSALTLDGGDRELITGIAAGLGDLAVINTHEWASLLQGGSPVEVQAAQAVGLIFPDQKMGGTHRDITGVGIARNAPNPVEARLFLEFLTSIEAQELYASSSYEYPAHRNVSPAPVIDQWRDKQFEGLAFAETMYFTSKAVDLMEKAGWE